MIRMNLLVSIVIVICAGAYLGAVDSSAFADGNQITSNPSPETYHDIIVVGAGTAGLTAGYFLKEHDVTILERNSYAGGSILSGTYEGIPYSIVPGIIDEPGTIFQRLVDELDLPLKRIPSPIHSYFYKQKTYYGPEGLALAAIGECGVEEYNRFITTVVSAYRLGYPSDSELHDLDAYTAKEWFDREKFAPVFYSLFEPKARQWFGAGLNEVSARYFLMNLDDEILEANPVTDASPLRNDPSLVVEKIPAYSFVNGLSEFTNAIANVLGDRIQYNSSVISVTRMGNRYIVSYSDAEGRTHTLNAKAVILALSASIALRLAPSALSEEQKTLLSGIPYSSYCYVSLYSQKPLFSKAFNLRVADGLFFSNIFDSLWLRRHILQNVQKENIHVTNLLVTPTTYQDLNFMNLTEDQLMEKVYADLETIFPGAKTLIAGYRLDRFSKNAPVMTVGSYKRLERLREISTGTLALAGSYSMSSSFQATINSGYLAAQQVVESLQNPSSVKYFDRYECDSPTW